MGIASIVLGILAVMFAAGGFLISFVPSVGAIPGALLTLTAPLLALIGIVLGGVGLSRAKSEGTETGLPTAGLIVSVIAFFPAFLVAITCGLCDMMCASAMLDAPSRSSSGDTNGTPYWMQDAGFGATSPGLGQPPPPPVYPTDPNAPPPQLLPPNPNPPSEVPPVQPEVVPPPPPIPPPEPPRPG
ncbi:MAG: hypothetical protein AB8I08_05220 [Sandaracinaceae bacterium]